MARGRKPAGNKDNRKPEAGATDAAALRRYVDRVKSLHAERQAINADISEVYEEAKEAGFVTKLLRQMVREQMMDTDVLRDQLAKLEQMRADLGLYADTPLGAAAMAAAEAPVAEGAPLH